MNNAPFFLSDAFWNETTQLPLEVSPPDDVASNFGSGTTWPSFDWLLDESHARQADVK